MPRLSRRAQRLAGLSVGYNVVEAAVAIAAGAAAGSTALVGFGLDSVVEVSSGVIVLWQFRHPVPEQRERQALRLMAVAFFALAAYVAIESVRTLLSGREPEHSTVGIALAAVSLAVMPVLSWAQRRTGRALSSSTVQADGTQTLLCTYLSAVLLGRAGAELDARLVLGRPGRRTRHRHGRGPGGPGGLARRGLLRAQRERRRVRPLRARRHRRRPAREHRSGPRRGPMSHDHSHGDDLADHRGRLAVVLGIAGTVLVVEVVGAVVSGSLALLADAGHMLTDVAGLTLAFVAAVLARRPATDAKTWGYRRAEVLAAAAQAAVLLAVGGFVLVEAVRRLIEPPEVTSGAMVVFGLVGLAGNIVGIAVLASGRSANLNMRAAFLEVVNDALGSVAVLVAALVIATTGWTRADAVASLVIGALIIPRTLRLLSETVNVLLESTPPGLDLTDVRERLQRHPHVHDVHDLHATQVATGLPVLTAHVVVDDSCFFDGHLGEMLDELQQCIVDDFDIEHSTIQFESAGHAEHEHETHP